MYTLNSDSNKTTPQKDHPAYIHVMIYESTHSSIPFPVFLNFIQFWQFDVYIKKSLTLFF